jgi:hypothetical protein
LFWMAITETRHTILISGDVIGDKIESLYHKYYQTYPELVLSFCCLGKFGVLVCFSSSEEETSGAFVTLHYYPSLLALIVLRHGIMPSCCECKILASRRNLVLELILLLHS